MGKISKGAVCEICRTTEQIQKHHVSYEPEIIQLLCVDCHKKIHRHGVGKAEGYEIKMSNDIKDSIIMLFASGATNKEIAKVFDVSYATASHWRMKLGFIGFSEYGWSGMGQMIDEKYSEPREIRADGSVIWSVKLLERSGLVSGENVIVKTVPGSGQIVIERLKGGE